MSGSKAGGLKAKEKNLARDPDFYKKIGGMNVASWIANGRKPRGFSVNKELARTAGKIGGTISRRTSKKI